MPGRKLKDTAQGVINDVNKKVVSAPHKFAFNVLTIVIARRGGTGHRRRAEIYQESHRWICESRGRRTS